MDVVKKNTQRLVVTKDGPRDRVELEANISCGDS